MTPRILRLILLGEREHLMRLAVPPDAACAGHNGESYTLAEIEAGLVWLDTVAPAVHVHLPIYNEVQNEIVCSACGEGLGGCDHRLPAALQAARAQGYQRADAIFRWLLGEEGDFPEFDPRRKWGWRTDLRRLLVRAGIDITPHR